MFVCLFVCVCVCVCVCVYIYIHTHTHICIYTYIHIYVHTYYRITFTILRIDVIFRRNQWSLLIYIHRLCTCKILQSQLLSACWPLASWLNYFLFWPTDVCIYLSIKTLKFTLLKDKLAVSLPSTRSLQPLKPACLR